MKALPMRIFVYTLWGLAVGTGLAMILNYENASGFAGTAPPHWLSGTPIPLDPNRVTLIMFAHPRCPCTRASLEELNHLLARSDGRIAAYVFFFKPAGYPKDWTRTDLWRSAAAIPGVKVQDDVDDALARKFGAETSGYVLLYDMHGELLFRGGITGSRGHAGDNSGENAIILLATGQKTSVTETPVYGCSLMDKSCGQNQPTP
jgi:hypothetical protein